MIGIFVLQCRYTVKILLFATPIVAYAAVWGLRIKPIMHHLQKLALISLFSTEHLTRREATRITEHELSRKQAVEKDPETQEMRA